jgi:hypothetical protein
VVRTWATLQVQDTGDTVCFEITFLVGLRLRPARDIAIVARYEVPGNETNGVRPARDG